MILNKKAEYVVAAMLCVSGCSGLRVGPGWNGFSVVGEAAVPYNSNNYDAMRKSAIAAAQADVVETVAGIYAYGSKTTSQLSPLPVFAKTHYGKIIKAYKILREGKEGEVFKTKIRAGVSVEDMAEALSSAGIFVTNPVPRVMVISNESGAGMEKNKQPGRDAIVAAIASGPYSVILPPPGIAPEDKNTPEEALDIARKNSAAIMVFCDAATYKLDASQFGGFVSYRARASLTIMSASGQVVAQISKDASGIDGVDSIAAQKALAAAADAAAKEAIAPLLSAAQGLPAFSVKVSGLGKLESLGNFVRAFKGMTAINGFVLRKYFRGEALFDVYARGLSAEEFMAVFMRESVYPVEPMSITQNAIELKVN